MASGTGGDRGDSTRLKLPMEWSANRPEFLENGRLIFLCAFDLG